MIKLNLQDSYQFLFWEESRVQIETIELEMLNIESGNYNEETIHKIFRMAHSLKGASATMEIVEMMRVAHGLEDILTLLKDQVVELDHKVMSIILEALDVLKWLHELLTLSDSHLDSSKETTDSEIIKNVEQIEQTIRTFKSNKVSLVKPLEGDEIGTAEVLAEVLTGTSEVLIGTAEVHIIFEEDAEMLAVKAYIVIKALSKLGRIVATVPSHYENREDDDFKVGFTVYIHTDLMDKSIVEMLMTISEIKEVIITPYQERQPLDSNLLNEQSSRMRTPTHSGLDVSSVRISIQRINQLINLVGELTLNKEILNDVTKILKTTYKKDKNITRLEDICESIQFLGSELQEIVLNARLIPLEMVFNKFPRMVRDLSHDFGKNIRLEIEGKDQGIDRSLIEELVDPLTQLIRNAVDHGFEDEITRIKNGKSAVGVLKLSANQGENQVVITVEDDGKGIDINKIKVKALTNNLISLEEAEHLNPSEWLEYIFKPGFSTADTITAISGRGVGLDVVKTNITKINGHIDLDTELGKGSKFTIKLPLTMAIMNVLLVKEKECIFGIPTSQIIEIIRLTEAEFEANIYRTSYSSILNWRETTIPMIPLADVFSLEAVKQSKKMYILILGTGERKMALVVEKILGEQEVVIKPMRDFIGKDKIFGELREITGVSVLGNGSLAQIIDVAMLNKN